MTGAASSPRAAAFKRALPLALAVAALVAAGVFGVLWWHERSHVSDLRASSAEKIKTQTDAAYNKGWLVGNDGAYDRIFPAPDWADGAWYVVQFKRKGSDIGFSYRSLDPIDASGAQAYWIKDGHVYASKRAATVPSAVPPPDCTNGDRRFGTTAVSCSEAISLYNRFLAGTLDPAWSCGTANALNGRCVAYGEWGDITAAFSWRGLSQPPRS